MKTTLFLLLLLAVALLAPTIVHAGTTPATDADDDDAGETTNPCFLTKLDTKGNSYSYDLSILAKHAK